MLSYFLNQIPTSKPSGSTSPTAQACLDRLAESSTGVLFRFHCVPKPTLEYANPAIEVMSGYPLASFYADPDLIFRMIHPQDRARVRQELVRGSSGMPLQIRWQHADSSIISVEQVIVPVYDSSGRLLSVEGAARLLQPAQPKAESLPGAADYRQHLLDISRRIAEDYSGEDVLTLIFHTLETFIKYDSCRVVIHSGQDNLAEILYGIFQKTGLNKIRLQISSHRSEVTTGILQLPGGDSGKPYQEMSMRLRLASDVFGSVHFTRPAQEPFDLSELELAHLLVFYICLAAENAGLLTGKITRSEALPGYVPSAEEINYPLNLEEVAESIGRQALDLTGLDAVSVMKITGAGVLKSLYTSGVSNAYLAHIALDQSGMLEGEPLENPVVLLIPEIGGLAEDSLARLLGEAEGFHSMAICPLISRGRVVATVNCYGTRPRPWKPEDREALDLFCRQAGIIYTNTLLYADLEESYGQTVLTLSRAIDVRDTYTSRHSQRLAEWAELTARRLDCSEEDIRTIRWAALLHDIGKIGIPDSVLCKAGPLNDEEWEIMRRHPVLGAEIIAPFKKLEDLTPLIRWHQEKFDGSGYPDGLRGHQIPLGARILTVVDAYGAMTDDRVYRKALTQEDALAELRRCSGTQFDSRVVQEFFKVINSSRVNASMAA